MAWILNSHYKNSSLIHYLSKTSNKFDETYGLDDALILF